MELNTKIPYVFEDLQEFCSFAAQFPKCKPGQVPSEAIRSLAFKLIDEEVNQETLLLLKRLKDTYSPELMAELLDGIVDSVYVLLWTAVMLQLPFNEAWNEVHKKNMDKFPPCTCATGCGRQGVTFIGDIEVTYKCKGGRLIYQNLHTGKVMKPEGWTPPDISAILLEFWADLIIKDDPVIQPTTLSSSNIKKRERKW